MPRKPKVPNHVKEHPTSDNQVQDDVLHIEVAENESKPLSLKERLLGKFENLGDGEETKKPNARSRKGSNDLIAKALPVVVNAFVVTLARNIIPDPYKMVAPTKEEVEAILNPFFSLLSRRIKVSYAASQDALDIIASLTAAMAYGTRAIITYEIIKKEVKAHDRTGVPTEDHRNGRDSGNQTPLSNGHTSFEDSNTEHAATEASIFSELFRKDIDGRKQMGLLDRGL